MNNHNILSVIASYLDVQSLAQFMLVNKLFNLVSKNDFLWDIHFIESFFSDLSMFGDIQKLKGNLLKNEKNCCQKLIKSLGELKASWRQLGKDLKQSEDFECLQTDFFCTLREPFLPIPVLRRDGFYFETIFQDLIGNFEIDSENGIFEEYSPAFDSLLKMQKSLSLYFTDSLHLHELTMSRWVLKKTEKEVNERDSMASQSTSGDIESSHLLINLAKMFKKTVKLHCRAVSLYLRSFIDGSSFLPAYNINWEAFCSSMRRIESLFYPLTSLLDQLFDQKYKLSLRTPVYSSSRVMSILWRREVIPVHGKRLINFLIAEIEKIRKSYLETESNHPEIAMLKKTVDSIVDLSIHELSVKFTQHSQFESTGLLADLKAAVLMSSENFYSSLNIKVHMLNRVLALDQSLISQLFIPSISEPVKNININIRLNSISSYYLQNFKNFPENQEDPPICPLATCRLALLLFKAEPSRSSKRKIQHFLSYLSETKDIELVNTYNSLIEELETPSYKDVEIDYSNRKIKKPNPQEVKLFSLSTDLQYDDLNTILANFSI